MAIPAGSVTAVIGPNGSGKSTLLKGIMGFPGVSVSGSASLNGLSIPDLNRMRRAKMVAYLPQTPPVPSGLTGLETVLLGRHPHRSSWAGDSDEDRDSAVKALKMVDALHLADKKVDCISGGEFRLVNLAAVLAQETPVILLDEPGSSLDYGHVSHLWQILSELARLGRTIVATTHRIGMAAGHFNRILLLSKGEQILFGDPESVFSRSDLLSDIYGTPLKTHQNSPGMGWIIYPGEEL